jgi:hypothetical protein
MRLRKKTAAEIISLEEPNDPDDEKDEPRKEIGAADRPAVGIDRSSKSATRRESASAQVQVDLCNARRGWL